MQPMANGHIKVRMPANTFQLPRSLCLWGREMKRHMAYLGEEGCLHLIFEKVIALIDKERHSYKIPKSAPPASRTV